MPILTGTTSLGLLSSPRRAIVTLLRRGGRTIPELASELAVSTNAVRGHLVALERDGVVERGETRRETVGKPARVYGLSAAGEELFPRAYAPVLLAFLDLIAEWDGADGLGEVLHEVGARLAVGADGGGAEGAARALRALGADATIDRATSQIVVSGCPLAAAVDARPQLCGLMTALVSSAAGAPAVERCERNGGRPRCRFALSELAES